MLSPHRKAAEQQADRWRSAAVACSLSGEDMTERVAQWRSVLDGAAGKKIPMGCG